MVTATRELERIGHWGRQNRANVLFKDLQQVSDRFETPRRFKPKTVLLHEPYNSIVRLKIGKGLRGGIIFSGDAYAPPNHFINFGRNDVVAIQTVERILGSSKTGSLGIAPIS